MSLNIHERPSQKRCPHCGRILPANAFSKDYTKKSGLRSWCRECCAEARRKKVFSEYNTENGTGFGYEIEVTDPKCFYQGVFKAISKKEAAKYIKEGYKAIIAFYKCS